MSNLIPTLKYLRTTTFHKWYVFRAGLKVRAPLWNLIIHDWTKFTRAEAPHYGRQFYGAADDPVGFGRAWVHHQNRNAHHWEYWIPRTGHDKGGFVAGEPAEMPEQYVREMVADWFGASRAYEGKWPVSQGSWRWFQMKFIGLRLHKKTRKRILEVMAGAGVE